MDQKRKPEGNPADAPLPRIRKSEWTIGTPDAIFSLPREIKVKATGQMPYVYLRVKTNFPEDRWIQATEVRPTAPEVVHHASCFRFRGGWYQKGTSRSFGRLRSWQYLR